MREEYAILEMNFDHKSKGAVCMKEQKYVCKMCGQTVKPLPDGSCPVCGAPKEMLVPVQDQDED